MDSPVGRIVSVADGRAIVSVDTARACARCAAGRGCGAGLLAGSSRSRLIEVELDPGMSLEPGDEVRLTLAPSHLLRAALLAYGFPLGGVIIALGLAWHMNRTLADQIAVGLAFAGLAAGLVVGRHFLNRDGCLKNLHPSIEERHA